MRRILSFICFFALLSCGNRNGAKNQEITFEEAAISTLQLYQNVDPQFAAERNEFYQLLLEHSGQEGEAGEGDKGYFLQNIVHIDSVVNQGAKLINAGRFEDLAVLLKGELPNFYAHPHNTVDVEIMLHKLIAELYHQTVDTYEEYIKEVIDLCGFTILHIDALEDKHPHYNTILIEQTCNCIDIGFYDQAIVYADKMRKFMQEEGDEEGLILSTLLLARAYEKSGQIEMHESAINSVKHLPQYAKCCEEVREISIFKD